MPTLPSSNAQHRRKYLVKDTATIRQGREKSSKKIGELRKGMVIDAVEEGVRDSQGLRLVLLQPPVAAAVDAVRSPYPVGGWVKIATSKGKVLLEELRKQAVQAADPVRGDAAEVEELETGRSTDV
jgi:hypothetical protein